MTHSPADMVAAAAPIIGLGTNVVLHVAISHAAPSVGFLRRAAVGVAGGALITAAASALALSPRAITPVDAVLLWLLAMLTYLALAFGYFNFVNLNVTSLRVRLLRELLEHYPHGLSRDQIVQRYGANTVLRLRVERLVASGHISRRGDRYYLARRDVLFIADTFTLLRRIIMPPAMSSR